MSTVIEIQTIEGGRLSWVAILSSSDREYAIDWGNAMDQARYPDGLKPSLRVVEAGKVVGAWNSRGYVEGEVVYNVAQ